MATRWLSKTSKCGFCGKAIPPETPYKYVYPVPKPHFTHLHEGRVCCLPCWPEVHQAQLDQGLVEDVMAEAHVHARTTA